MTSNMPLFPPKAKSGGSTPGATGATGATGPSYFSENANGIYYLGNMGVGSTATSTAVLNVGGDIANIQNLGFNSSVSNLTKFKMITFQYTTTLTTPINPNTTGGVTINFPYSFGSLPIPPPMVFVTIVDTGSPGTIAPARISSATTVISNSGFNLQLYNGSTSNTLTGITCNILAIGE
jgi:hypothetical protein